MLKYFLKDYIAVYRWGSLKHTFADKDKRWVWDQGWWYVFFMMPTFRDIWKSASDIGVSCCILVAMFVIWLSVILHPLKPKKVMYLCPMNKRERGRYIYRMFFFRMLVNMLVAVVSVYIVYWMTGCGLSNMLGILWNDFIIAMMLPPVQLRDEAYKKTFEYFFRGLMVPAAVIGNSYILWAVTDGIMPGADDVSEPDVIGVVLISAVIFVEAVFVIRYFKCIKQNMDDAVIYEEKRELKFL